MEDGTMNIDQLITQLRKLRAQHGDRVPVRDAVVTGAEAAIDHECQCGVIDIITQDNAIGA